MATWSCPIDYNRKATDVEQLEETLYHEGRKDFCQLHFSPWTFAPYSLFCVLATIKKQTNRYAVLRVTINSYVQTEETLSYKGYTGSCITRINT